MLLLAKLNDVFSIAVKFSITYRLLGIAFLLISVSACGVLGKRHPEMHGRVIHEVHDKPLSHTTLVALWKGEQQGGSDKKTICYHVEYTVSDENGFFTIPEWREPGEFKNLKNKTIHVYGYRKRYRTSELTSEIITPKNYIYYLAKPRKIDDEKKAREARLRYLQLLIGKTTCDLKGESRVNLKPMYTAIVAEAESLVVTDQDRQTVQKLKSWLSFVTPVEK